MGRTTTFLDQSLQNEDFFVAALRALNFRSRTFSSFLKSYQSIVTSSASKQTMLARLKDLIGRRQYKKVGASRTVLANIPLFLLSSPPVVGAKVTYDETAAAAAKGGWLVKVLGIGMGKTTTLEVTHGFGVTSENGEGLQIFLPVNLRVQTVGVYKSGKRESLGTRVEVKGWEPGDIIHHTVCRSLSQEQTRAVQLGTCENHDYPLSDDQGVHPTIHRGGWTLKKGRTADLSLSMSIPNSQFQLTGETSRRVELQLRFELPGSHFYLLHASPKGLRWEVDPWSQTGVDVLTAVPVAA